MNRKVIVRIKGGLGNQLFCFAAALRLARVNDAELVLDDTSGFIRDWEYKRQFELGVFHINARRATRNERLEPFERLRRGLSAYMASMMRFEERHYVRQELQEFDERLLRLRVKRSVYLDGLWQSERYFKDIEPIVRQQLQFRSPVDDENLRVGEKLSHLNAVALHVRWFDQHQDGTSHNASGDYYQRAIEQMRARVEGCHFFIFSDKPAEVAAKLRLPKRDFTIIDHNRNENSWADMWLMSQASNHIIANSTFSWWGAWLSSTRRPNVIAPSSTSTQGKWGFAGHLPEEWSQL